MEVDVFKDRKTVEALLCKWCVVVRIALLVGYLGARNLFQYHIDWIRTRVIADIQTLFNCPCDTSQMWFILVLPELFFIPRS
jgi:hypothetical protein